MSQGGGESWNPVCCARKPTFDALAVEAAEELEGYALCLSFKTGHAVNKEKNVYLIDREREREGLTHQGTISDE